MSLSRLRSIASKLQSSTMFAVMADECVDISNHEQLAICFCWVDIGLEVHDDFARLYEIPDISARTIIHGLKDCFIRMNLN